jgi:hypothetical protein
MRMERYLPIGLLIGILLSMGSPAPAASSAGEGRGADPSVGRNAAPRTSENVEKLMMEGTEIQGTLDKPHVVYVIPWNNLPSDPDGGISLRRSFRNEILEPVDREHFQHQWGRVPRGGG